MNRFWFSRFLGLPDPGGARVPLEALGATMSTRDALSSALADFEATDAYVQTHRYNSHDNTITPRRALRIRHANAIHSSVAGQPGLLCLLVRDPETMGRSSARLTATRMPAWRSIEHHEGLYRRL